MAVSEGAAAMVGTSNEQPPSGIASGFATHGNGQQQTQLEHNHSGTLIRNSYLGEMYCICRNVFTMVML